MEIPVKREAKCWKWAKVEQECFLKCRCGIHLVKVSNLHNCEEDVNLSDDNVVPSIFIHLKLRTNQQHHWHQGCGMWSYWNAQTGARTEGCSFGGSLAGSPKAEHRLDTTPIPVPRDWKEVWASHKAFMRRSARKSNSFRESKVNVLSWTYNFKRKLLWWPQIYLPCGKTKIKSLKDWGIPEC